MWGFIDIQANSTHEVQYRSLVRNLSEIRSVRLIKKHGGEGDFRKTFYLIRARNE